MTQSPSPCVATIGFFDGVHLGHLHLVDQLLSVAHTQGLSSAIVTFRQHPRQVLASDYIPQLLTPPDTKERLLRLTGVDRVITMDFTIELSRLSAHDFMRFLRKVHEVKTLIIGYDHRFGHLRDESFDDYVRFGQELGIHVLPADVFSLGDTPISSSAIRRLLLAGNIRLANSYLGRPYGFYGTVVRGRGEGRKLGFPTANMLLPTAQLVPLRGVYAVHVRIEGIDEEYLGMMNIGLRPTFGCSVETVEVHIFHFDQDIYDRRLTIEFLGRLRDERKFSSPSSLISQLNQDKQDILQGRYE